ncbi:MliC family protein [Sinirhodobacter sp. HNIBRBA609]|nr:MliC family protein [Sinirhodobacter sp. HNIBRBA609]
MKRVAALMASGALAAGAWAQEPATVPLDYQCENGARFALALDRQDDLIYGAILGRPVLLEHVISGSGARYAERDAADRGGRYELWMKGDEAMLNWTTGEDSLTLLSGCRIIE